MSSGKCKCKNMITHPSGGKSEVWENQCSDTWKTEAACSRGGCVTLTYQFGFQNNLGYAVKLDLWKQYSTSFISPLKHIDKLAKFRVIHYGTVPKKKNLKRTLKERMCSLEICTARGQNSAATLSVCSIDNYVLLALGCCLGGNRWSINTSWPG